MTQHQHRLAATYAAWARAAQVQADRQLRTAAWTGRRSKRLKTRYRRQLAAGAQRP